MARPTRITINLAALRHNLARVRAYAPRQRVTAMVKANAYGHGLVHAACALAGAGADSFGVASLEEAITLRDAGIVQPIILVEGVFSADELGSVQQFDLQIIVHHLLQVEWLEQLAEFSRPIKVWLKIDSGMHRLGLQSVEVNEACQRLRACPAVDAEIGLMTHLANADDLGDDYTHWQLRDFNRSTAGLSGPRSIGNSAGLMGWPDCHADWVRPGIMLYGVSPFSLGSGVDHGLLPVMTLRSELIAVREHRAGEKIGYGGTWICPQDMLVGVVAVGYGDGYPRHAQAGTPVLVNGKRVPLIGRVSMDMIMVDLRAQPAARPGDPVVLWGDGLPVEEVARDAGTIAYELLCTVTLRVPVECVG